MPKRKKQPDADAARSGSSSGKTAKANNPESKPVTLPSFFTLPEEIRSMILSHICAKEGSAGSPIRSSDGNKWKVDLDLNMLRSLALVSKQFHGYFTPLLYAHVQIDTPSALRQLDAALSSRPSLALLVKSLHLGPLKDLHEMFWPVRMKEESEHPFQGDEPMVFAKTGLGVGEEKLRPRGVRADKEFAYEDGNTRADKILRQAFEEMDVEPMQECFFEDTDGDFIGIVEWTKRIFWVQGILDLYLSRMRELEDAKESSDGKRVSYPRLVLEGFGHQAGGSREAGAAASAGQIASTKGKGKKTNEFVITPKQIEDFWTRPGAHTDHFDHPLYFAQPGLRYLARSVHEQVIVDPEDIEEDSYLAHGTDKKQPSMTHDGSDQDAKPSGQEVKNEDKEAEKEDHDSESEAAPRKSKSGSFTTAPVSPSGRLTRDILLTLGNSVLERTTNVTNLSLTGIFHHCMQKSELPVLQHLRYLSVGPLTPPRDAALCIEEEKTMLPALVKLRVCGSYPGIGVAGLIGGECEGLPSLQEAHWDFGDLKADKIGGATFLWKMVNIMRGADETAEPNPFLQEHPPPCRYVEFRVHSTYVQALLDMASTPEIKTALAAGQPASDAQRPLRIMSSRAETERPYLWSSPPQQLDVLRREGQEWWKERALELERS